MTVDSLLYVGPWIESKLSGLVANAFVHGALLPALHLLF